MGVFGTIIAAIQVGFTEWNTLLTTTWTGPAIGWFIGYALLLFLMYLCTAVCSCLRLKQSSISWVSLMLLPSTWTSSPLTCMRHLLPLSCLEMFLDTSITFPYVWRSLASSSIIFMITSPFSRTRQQVRNRRVLIWIVYVLDEWRWCLYRRYQKYNSLNELMLWRYCYSLIFVLFF